MDLGIIIDSPEMFFEGTKIKFIFLDAGYAYPNAGI